MAEQQDLLNQQRASSFYRRSFILPAIMIVVVAGIVAMLVFRGGTHRSNTAAEESADWSETSLENVRAFAKIYGYVKYFHPSDAASTIDWERFAVHGVRTVIDVSSPADLKETLEALFLPIAPTIQIYADEEDPPAPTAGLTPADTTGLKLVAWQHLGVGLGNPGPYRSIRLNRLAEAPTRPSRTFFVQHIDAAPFRGTTIRLSTSVRTDVSGDGNQAHVALYTALPGGQAGFMDFMEDRPITNPEWETYTITGIVGKDADSIGVGGMFLGSGRAWFDDFQLHVRAEGEAQWSPVRLDNAGFEANAEEDFPGGWDIQGEGYRVQIDMLEAYEGRGSLAIEYDDVPRMTRPLFEEHPKAGEVVERPLGRGLSAQIPLALYSRDGQTLRPDDAPPVDRLEAELEQIALDELTGADDALRYADVVTAWNVLQHFYPYFDVVDVDWDTVLTRTLRQANTDQTPKDFLQTLRWMVAQLDDGHANIEYPSTEHEARPPFLVDEVEGEIAIVAVHYTVSDEACFSWGDVVVSIDGVVSMGIVRASEKLISGSPQWKKRLALRTLGHGEQGSVAHLILDRQGETVSCDVVRSFRGGIWENRPTTLRELRDGVYYVNLSTTSMNDIEHQADALAGAKAVMFDLRGYTRDNVSVLQYLSEHTLHSTLWHIPKQIYPDQMNFVGYDTTATIRWTLPPKEPQFTGKIVFLTDSNAMSQPESVLGIVEHYGLGEIVGQQTAGVTGNANPFTLPSGYRVWWTGMRVIKHDGSLHHITGIQPTVPVERTLEGVRAGRDEVLEEALNVIERW